MEKITKIDVLVHPFFTYYCSNSKIAESVPDEDAETFLEIWKQCVDDIKEDEKRILIFVSNLLKEEDFRSIKKGIKIPRFEYEARLAEHAYRTLNERLFFFYDTLEGNFLTRIEHVITKDPKVLVYGEWTSACCRREAELLSEKLRIPRSNFSLLPKKSFDISAGYPSKKELARMMRLPKPQRTTIIRERMKLYTDMLKEFKEGR